MGIVRAATKPNMTIRTIKAITAIGLSIADLINEFIIVLLFYPDLFHFLVWLGFFGEPSSFLF